MRRHLRQGGSPDRRAIRFAQPITNRAPAQAVNPASSVHPGNISWKRIWHFLRAAFAEFTKDNAPQYAAAMAFYAIVSLAPLLILAIAIAGVVYGPQAARGEIVATVQQFVGHDVAVAVQKIIVNARDNSGGAFTGVLSFVVLLWSASRIFQQLKVALNAIMDVPEQDEGGLMQIVLDRLLSLVMVFAVGLVLLISVLISAVLSRLGQVIQSPIPGGAFVWQVISFVVFFGLITGVVTLIFKIVPDVDLGWRESAIGAAFTAVLFAIGQVVIGYYLGRSNVGSSYGTAGSLILILIWVYFTTFIFFFGAECTEMWARENPDFVRDRNRRKGQGGREAKPGPGSAEPAGSTMESSTSMRPGAARADIPEAAPPRPASEGRPGGGLVVAGLVGGALIGALAGAIGTVVALAKMVRRQVLR